MPSFYLKYSPSHRYLHSFPTRRSSDLGLRARGCDVPIVADIHFKPEAAIEAAKWVDKVRINPGNYADSKDRKSTRLNSSHVRISYAVFCLKKKKIFQLSC